MRRILLSVAVSVIMTTSINAMAQYAKQTGQLPEGTVVELLERFSQMPKDPNFQDEYDHMLYWMGGFPRCHVMRGSKKSSILETQVMLSTAYERFGDQLPNMETLFVISSKARGQYAKDLVGEEATVKDQNVMLKCLRQEPIPIMGWLFPELHRYRAVKKANQA